MAGPGGPLPAVGVLVEEGGGGQAAESPRRAFLSASATLTLAILGSTVLPVPFAFSRLGVLPGLAIMLTVALANTMVGTLLLRCAGSLHKHTFEGLAEAVGGSSWKVRLLPQQQLGKQQRLVVIVLLRFALACLLGRGESGGHQLLLLTRCQSPSPVCPPGCPSAGDHPSVPGAAAVWQPGC
jgi:hypothetical protein